MLDNIVTLKSGLGVNSRSLEVITIIMLIIINEAYAEKLTNCLRLKTMIK